MSSTSKRKSSESNRGKKPSKKRIIWARNACGLCGGIDSLYKSECCNNWICDADKFINNRYTSFNCQKNHKYTLCWSHFVEGHSGKWQDCEECREMFDFEAYKEFATAPENFEKLDESKIMLKCAACIFESHTPPDFASSVLEDDTKIWYCKNEECEKARNVELDS